MAPRNSLTPYSLFVCMPRGFGKYLVRWNIDYVTRTFLLLWCVRKTELNLSSEWIHNVSSSELALEENCPDVWVSNHTKNTFDKQYRRTKELGRIGSSAYARDASIRKTLYECFSICRWGVWFATQLRRPDDKQESTEGSTRRYSADKRARG